MATTPDSESASRSSVASDATMRQGRTARVLWYATAVLLCLPVASALADVKHNAGRRTAGGMGLDINWYCKQVHGSSSVSTSVDQTANGWRCTAGHQLVGVSIEDACRRHYGNNASERLASTKRATDWYCVLGLNLDWYCKGAYGENSRARKLFADNPRSWKCQRGGDLLALDIQDACRKHYAPRAIAILGRHEDPQAWTCEIR